MIGSDGLGMGPTLTGVAGLLDPIGLGESMPEAAGILMGAAAHVGIRGDAIGHMEGDPGEGSGPFPMGRGP